MADGQPGSQVDYDALAAQHGGTSTSAAGVDYDSLASAHGGSVSSAGGTSAPYWDELKAKYGLPKNTDLARVDTNPLMSRLLGTGDEAFHAFTSNIISDRLSSEEKNKIDAGKFMAAYNEANGLDKPAPTTFFGRMGNEFQNIWHGLTGYQSPTLAPPVAETAQNIAVRGKEALEHPAAAAGAATADLLAAAGPIAAAKVLPEVPGAIRSGWRVIGNPMGLASTGEELLTQGISPRTSLLGFKPALQKASADLKAFDATSRIESVQDLHEAIPEIKQKIWSEEVEPALQRQAQKPVNMQPVADAVRSQISPWMKEFDEANATKLETLASKLESARNVQDANGLLKYINGQLESYFQKFPAARKANLMNNPETAGWEAARAELRNQFLNTMEQNGEAGVRDARMRYGAFDTLQDAVERRVNVADRQKPMPLARILGIVGAVPTGGLSLAAGELSNYLNKPDVLVKRGISKLSSEPLPQGSPTLFPKLAAIAAIDQASQPRAVNQ